MSPMPLPPDLPPVPKVKGATPWSDGTIEAAHADVMHFPMQAAFKTSVPSIYQPWDLQHLHLPEFFTPEQHLRRQAAYPTFSRRASMLVVASQWVKDDVVAAFGVPAERIEVVPVPPPVDAYPAPDTAEADRIAAALGLPERFVYYPAQTWPHKNHARLFEALHLLRERGLRVPLVSTGRRNAHYAVLVEQARDLGILDQLLFLDFVDTAAVRVLYERARALVFPSLYEGWGLPVIEAFRLGLPVACSNVTSLPDLVGDAALVFDPLDTPSIAEAIERLWTDDALAAQLAGRGREIAAEFEWATTAATMRTLYQRVAGCPQRGDGAVVAAGSTPTGPGSTLDRQPVITVIVAVFNGAATLQRALDSIFEQDYAKLEVVVMDGGSTDGTLEILERNADRFRHWESGPDGGVFDAWNKALPHASGEWVCFLGADDRYHDGTVMGRVAEALGTRAEGRRVAYGRLLKTWPDGRTWTSRLPKWDKKRRRAFRRGVMIPHPATFHHRSLFDDIGTFDTSFRIAGDYDFMLRALREERPMRIGVVVVDMAAGGLSDRPENRVAVAREVYRARRKNGTARLPGWCSPGYGITLLRTWWRWQGKPKLTGRPPV